MILRRYLFREIGRAFAGVLLVLMLVYTSFRFVRLFAEAAAGRLARDVIFELVGLKLIGNLAVLLPLALYLGVLLGLGRLYRDSEVVAMSAGGYGVRRLAASVLWLGLGFGAVSAALSLYLTPTLFDVADTISKNARSSTQISGVFPGRFKEYGQGDRIFYVESIREDRRTMSNVFVQIRKRNRLDVLFSERARHEVDPATGDRFMVLEDGRQYEGEPGDANYSVTRFERYGVRLDRSEEAPGYRQPEAVPTSELLLSSQPWLVAELQWRLSVPLAAVLLAMLAVPLARAPPGRGRVWQLFLGVLVYFIYNNLLGVAQKSVESGALAPAIGVWPVHAVLALSVTAMILYQDQQRWRAPRWLRTPAAARRLMRSLPGLGRRRRR